ncbi:MAG: twin-arginine translocase TatA/TatE family subunit [Beutenbergiaceae bacterium]
MNFDEVVVIIVIALVVIGPHRLPQYAEQLGKLVRNVRSMATGATQNIREELGDDIADLDLTKFDPRQYDPRRIVREALLEDIVPATKPAPKAGAKAAAAATSTSPVVKKPATAATVAAVGAGAISRGPGAGATGPDSPAPFDDEAT